MSLAVTIGTDLTFGGRPSRPKGSKSYIIWGFPKIRGTLFWGPYNKDPTTSGTILWFPIFGNSHMGNTHRNHNSNAYRRNLAFYYVDTYVRPL